MSREAWIEDRLFVLEQLVQKMMRIVPMHERRNILAALVTTCEGDRGTLAMAEHLQATIAPEESCDEGSENPAKPLGDLVDYANQMHAIYGDLSSSK